MHHGTLPLGPVAVLLTPSFEYAFVLVPLVILLFPDGRPGPRWRWPLRAYLAVVVLAVAATLSLAVAATGLRTPVDANGNLSPPTAAPTPGLDRCRGCQPRWWCCS